MPHNIKDYSTEDVIGVLLWDQRIMEEMYNKSLPLSQDNEFQFHMNMLNITAHIENQYLYISIPLVIYNYKQEVSTSSVKFELTEVEELASKLMPLSKAKISDRYISDVLDYIKRFVPDYKLQVSTMSNLHFHPGGLDRFSGTDYDKNPNNPGICFPYKTAEAAPIWSLIGLRNPLRLGHAELRLADGNVSKEMNYYHGKSVTIVKGIKKEPTMIENLFGIKPDNSETYFIEDKLKASHFIEELALIWEKTDYMPNTEIIVSDNISKLTYVPRESRHKWEGYNNMMDSYWANKEEERTVSKVMEMKVKDLKKALVTDYHYDYSELKGQKKQELQDLLLENLDIELEYENHKKREETNLLDWSNYHWGNL